MSPARIRTFTPVGAADAANRLANWCLIPLLNGPAGGRLGRRLAVLEYSGRRTGQHHQLVVMYVAEGPTVRITVGMAEHKTWWRNFEDPRSLRLRLAGIDHAGVAHVVREHERVMVIAELTPRADLDDKTIGVDRESAVRPT